MAGTTEHTAKTPLGGVKAFSCRNCGGQVELRAPGQSMTAVCQHCSSIVDVTDENFRILQKYNEQLKYKPKIPLGRRGEMRGVTWEVVGFMTRKAVGYNYIWEEYLLFNPRQGFRWLLNQYGHWSWTKPLMEPPMRTSVQFQYQGDQYKRYSQGKAEVRFVMGEFYWQVRKNDAAKTADWVRSGRMLSVEVDDYGVNWTESEYIEPPEVQKAFGKDVQLPRPSGIAPHQPNPFSKQLKSILPIYVIAIIALIVSQVFFNSRFENKPAMTMRQMAAHNDSIQVSEPFELGGGTSNAQVDLYTPELSNSWFEIEGYLHNLETNVNYSFEVSNEYYAGVSGGERWTEGSKTNNMVVNGVPAGRYELAFTPYFNGKDGTDKPYQEYSVYVYRGVPITSNMFIILIILSIPVLYLVLRNSSFKKAQWADAD